MSKTTKLTKTDFIKQFAETNSISQTEATKLCESFLDLIGKNLEKDKEVTFIGFGTFRKSTRKARKGVNPKTGESIDIAESTSVSFKAGKRLKERVN